MCGINGIHSKSLMNKKDLISKMNKKLIHRGPDQDGQFISDKIGLGIRRLSIIDLNTGNQPIFSEDKNLVIVFNGEIYNYKEIRESLLKENVVFKTNSDTEVILKSYEKFGSKCLSLFRGMFAFSIYNLDKDELFLARDFYGEKPLYYSNQNEYFIFSSELKPILESKLISKNINKNSLSIYLQLGYVPAPHTLIEGVYKLEAGSYLILKEGKFTIEKYIPNVSIQSLNLNSNDKQSNVRDIIDKSVQEAMVSDVPIGVFLSGGIDSAIITYHAQKNSKKPIKAFTLGFSNSELDETKKASLTSKHLKTEHFIQYVNEENLSNEIDHILNNIDEPIADTSFIATYLVSKFASKSVKVVLTGDGGDELYGGYEKYLINKYCDLYNLLPKFIKDLLDFFIRKTINNKSSFFRKYEKIKQNAPLSVESRIINSMVLYFKKEELSKLLINNNHFDSLTFIRESLGFFLKNNDILTSSLLLDQKYTLEGAMLAKVDKASMLNSIETRSPILNPFSAFYANKMSIKDKINNFQKKFLLRKSYKNILPSKIINSSKKGFHSPISYWMRNGLLNNFNHFFEKKFIEIQGLFSYEYMAVLKENHFKDKEDNGNRLWNYIVFQNWYNLIIK
jgi:asparagine synthase (glutamine-hydrolysing)